ncbi:hypothetical protein NA8A_04848 [Nitratireductor indicus C115]|uniref:Transglycosylase SLT domain-containing protein n=1 Tax=Nitratireductor indicus C115 TaxID=1231190 RepID=K2P7W7_9HYPH|nr:hypothetical protein NA8A_04848 [Nitratireductor indicus C115]SFQ09851.1 Transglycosylase SLT domain-containing protein [Nitratireductor indicus]
MAKIPEFTAKAPRLPALAVDNDTGAAQALASVAAASSQLAGRLGKIARDRAVTAAREKGAADAANVSMPGVDFAFQPGTPGKRPSRGQVNAPAGIRDVIVAAAQRHGVDPAALMKMAELESSFNPNAKNPSSSAGGLFQFVDSTAAQYGLANRYDPAQAADAAARLARDNAAHLQKVLGRKPTAAELYLAHQQGAGGAGKLLANPNARAADIVGSDAVRLNGGRANMTAGEFAGLWLAKAGGPVAAQPGKVSVSLTGARGALPRAQPGTLVGDAYNEAATAVYANRLESSMRAQMDAIALEHEGKPAEMQAALDPLRAGFTEGLPPILRAKMLASFDATSLSLQRQAMQKARSNLDEELKASSEGLIDTQTTNILRLAAKAGTDKQADQALTQELAGLNQTIDNAPGMTPLARERLKRATANDVYAARILSGFDGLATPAERAAYAEQVQTEWQNGEGLAQNLDADAFHKVNSELARRVQQDATAASKQATAIGNAFNEQTRILKKGLPVTEAQRSTLRKAVAETGDEQLAARADFFDQLASWQSAHLAARPEAIEQQMVQLQRRMQQEGATEATLDTLDVMEGLHKAMKAGLRDDPLTWAARAGVTDVAPLDFSDSQRLTASLSERANDAQAVAEHYGIQPRYFTANEADAIKRQFEENPLAMPSLLSGLEAGLGNAMPDAMREVSQSAPVLAHMAGLIAATGNESVATEVATMLDTRRQEGYKSALPSQGKMSQVFAAATGAALAGLPRTAAAARETAALIFEKRALARGVDPANAADPLDPAHELLTEAIDAALGATMRDGQKFGGLTMVNGRQTVAPPDMPAADLDTRLSKLTDGQLANQMAIAGGDHRISARDIRNGYLEMVAPGRYRVALQDPATGDPQYVPAPAELGTGGYFILDMEQLVRDQGELGSGFFGYFR